MQLRNGKTLPLILTAFVFGMTCATARAEANIEAGKNVFKKCGSCHSLEEGKNKVGPSLYGIYGAEAAKVDGFKYSKVMKESGIVWDDENLTAFLTKPKKFMKGTKMSFAGIKKAEQLENLIAYLKSTSSSE